MWLIDQFWPFTVDDTFITLRYARNVATGEGLTWNPGEPPVEGYTSLLWTIVLAVPHLWSTDGEVPAKVLGIVCTGVSIVLVAALTHQVTRHRSRAEAWTAMMLGAFVLSADLASAVHAVSGMDTALFTTMMVALSGVAVCVIERPTESRFRGLAVVGLALGLTRPEGNLAFLVVCLVIMRSLAPPQRGAFVRAVGGFFAIPATAYFLGRWIHFGLPLPLPFYVKAVGQEHWLAGIDEAWSFVRSFALDRPWVGLSFVVGLAATPRHLRSVLWAAAALFVFFLKPAPLMAYNHRYLYPITPMLCVYVGVGAARIGVVLVHLWKRGASLKGLVLMSGLVVYDAASHTMDTLPGHLDEKLSYGAGLRAAHMRLGYALQHLDVTQKRIALLDVGAVAYVSGWAVVDTFGLNDAYIARRGRGDAEYVLAQDPEVIVVVSRSAERYEAVFPYEESLVVASLASGFVSVRSFEFVPDYHLWVFARGGSPALSLGHDESDLVLANTVRE